MFIVVFRFSARSRTRKKKKARIVACAPAFPAIVEKVAEEKRETLEVELQVSTVPAGT